jgi:formamidopyrimidine-DNA glycosylase
MPELPEVETTVQELRAPLVGQTITGIRNQWLRHIATPSLSSFQERVRGRTVQNINRRGKYLVFKLDGRETLIIHLKMTGNLTVVPADMPIEDHVHTVFTLANGHELRFRDTRKFGRVYLVRDRDEVLGNLGPEPLSSGFTAELFHEMLQGRKRVLKPLLLDQTFIAGIGNIYADEALHLAKIHPLRKSNTLNIDESKSLHAAIQEILLLAISRGGASVDDYRKPDGTKGEMQTLLSVYSREDEPCLQCGRPIERCVLSGRSTHYCPGCQK